MLFIISTPLLSSFMASAEREAQLSQAPFACSRFFVALHIGVNSPTGTWNRHLSEMKRISSASPIGRAARRIYGVAMNSDALNT
jgi:hypothetical protein